MNPSHHERRIGLIALIAVIIIWSPSFAAIRVALRGFGPNEQALLRFALASALLTVPWWITGHRIPISRDLPRVALTGALGVTGYQVLLGYGEQSVSAGTAALLTATSPLFVIVLAAIFLTERFTPAGVTGVVLGFTGTAIIGFAAEGRLDTRLGAVAIIGAAICQALWVVLQKPLLARYNPVDLTTWTIWAGTTLLLPATPSAIHDLTTAPPSAALAIAWLGIGSSALGFFIFAAAASRLPSSVAGSAFYLLPPGALLISWLWLGEHISASEAVGGLLALIGVALVTHTSTHVEHEALPRIPGSPPPDTPRSN
jgi:drug/metabolite transporter (DMT)-like permease